MIGDVLGVATDLRTYARIAYLLLAFPLGIGYFVFLVTGFALGFGLLIIWVGVLILVLLLAGTWLLSQWERLLAIVLLGETIPVMKQRSLASESGRAASGLSLEERLFVGAWRRMKEHLTDRLTWTGIGYLFLKFPIGIALFVLVVVLVAVTAALLGAPFYYWVGDGIEIGRWRVDSLPEALLLTLAGAPMALLSLHLMSLAGLLSGKLARVMLGRLGCSLSPSSDN